MYNIINEAHVYDLPKRPSQTTTSAGKSFHGTVRRTRDPRRHIIDARSRHWWADIQNYDIDSWKVSRLTAGFYC